MFIGVLSTPEAMAKYVSDEMLSEFLTIQYYDIEQYRGFTDFISRTKAIFNFQALVVDLDECELSVDDIKKGVNLHEQYCSAKLIFCANYENNESMDALQNAQVYRVVNIADHMFAKKLKSALFGENKNISDDIKGKINSNIQIAKLLTQPSIHLKNGQKLTIGIAGCMPRSGVTTLALSIVNSLIFAGVSGCYIDISGKHLDLFEKLYEHDEKKINSLPASRSPLPQADVQVFDCEQNTDEMQKYDIQILVSTSKLWELPQAAAEYKEIPSVQMVFNLAGIEDTKRISEIWEKGVYFMPFIDDVWETQNAILCPWLKNIIERQ